MRVGFATVIALSVVLLATAVLAAGSGDQSAHVTGTGQTVAPPSDGVTVVATDSNTWLGRSGDGPRATAQLFAVGPDGTVFYYNDSHTRYWDVDPVAGTNATVEYVYADHLTPEECGGETACTRNGVERVNLTTGEVTTGEVATGERVTGTDRMRMNGRVTETDWIQPNNRRVRENARGS